MKNYKQLISAKNIPRHVAIIMDGNGRWAQKHSLPRTEGHRKAADVIEPIVDTCLEMGIQALTLYAFSTENWLRPVSEVRTLWDILDYYFSLKLESIIEKGIRIKHSGSSKKIPSRTKKTIINAVSQTEKNKNMVLNFCLNYGGHQEILDAVNGWLKTRKGSREITAKDIEKNLYTSDLPEVDLMVRTSGEYRISNFLLWQLAYTELVFFDVLWPDFKQSDFYKAIYLYQQRERRYGGV